jgi:hypothetical protein
MPLEILLGAALGAAATSAVTSEKIRKGLRKGVVYGLAGALMAYDQVAAVTKGTIQGARKVVQEGVEGEQPTAAAGAQTSAAAHAPASPSENKATG